MKKARSLNGISVMPLTHPLVLSSCTGLKSVETEDLSILNETPPTGKREHHSQWDYIYISIYIYMSVGSTLTVSLHMTITVYMYIPWIRQLRGFHEWIVCGLGTASQDDRSKNIDRKSSMFCSLVCSWYVIGWALCLVSCLLAPPHPHPPPTQTHTHTHTHTMLKIHRWDMLVLSMKSLSN